MQDMSDDLIRVGCFRCKRTRRNEQIAAAAHKTIEDVFKNTFDFIRQEAKDVGVDIDEELRAKLLKWGAKQGLFTHPEVSPDRVRLSAKKAE